MAKIRLGLEKLVSSELKLVRGAKCGLLAHPSSTGSNLAHALDLLLEAGVRVVRLFGPEHGFGGEAQDMEAVVGECRGPFGLPLVSLYGASPETLAPTSAQIDGLDVLIIDLFDVGARYYTFVWTALLCLRACSSRGVRAIVVDRPNPLNGTAVEGAPQQLNYLSFVGLAPVSNRHGLTLGELVALAAHREGIDAALTVVTMDGWRREMSFAKTELPWVLPSPNMPTLDTALVYPGLCLIEATACSEGRGTTRPFELCGAPFVDGRRLAERLLAMDLQGVVFRPVSFRPGFQKHAGTICGGVQLHVCDEARFLPYRTGVAVLLALKSELGERFSWRHAPYEFVSDIPAIDLLTGSPEVRLAVDAGAQLEEIAATWSKGQAEFAERRRPFLLYEP